MGADPFTTSQHLKMCTIIQYLLYHKICQISISERVLRKILSRCNQWIYKALQAFILLYMKLSYHTIHSEHSIYKSEISPPKCTVNFILSANPKKVFNSHRNHHNRIISCTEISAYRIPRHRNLRRGNNGRY